MIKCQEVRGWRRDHAARAQRHGPVQHGALDHGARPAAPGRITFEVAEIWQVLQALKAEGQAILVIDKNLEALTRLADRHTIIEKGQAVWSGSSAELAADPALKARYLGV